MHTAKPNWTRIGLLIAGLGILAVVLGWGIHFVLDALSGSATPTTAPPLTATLPAQAPDPTETPLVALSVTTPSESTPSPPLATSTPRPTSTPNPTPAGPVVVTVNPGEGLYQVCRRHCAGCWGDNELPASLMDYAEKVARENNIPWNFGNPLLRKSHLTMPLCPPECTP